MNPPEIVPCKMQGLVTNRNLKINKTSVALRSGKRRELPDIQPFCWGAGEVDVEELVQPLSLLWILF
jgi:hypothetical protein